jgi:hypothetical protein
MGERETRYQSAATKNGAVGVIAGEGSQAMSDVIRARSDGYRTHREQSRLQPRQVVRVHAVALR